MNKRDYFTFMHKRDVLIKLEIILAQKAHRYPRVNPGSLKPLQLQMKLT